MKFSISTHWNAFRHSDGRAMIEEILELGFDRVELGYDTRLDLVPGIQAMVSEGTVTVDSVHNFCPVPIGAPRGHPELWTPGSSDASTRERAVHHISRTIEFAAEMGASVVVAHAGNVQMPRLSGDLVDMCMRGERFTPRYEKLKMKLQAKRDKKAPRQFEALCESVEKLLPVLEEHRVVLAFEILPTWEAIPSELEFEELFRRYPTPWIKYWHDIGHGQIRENLGFINTYRWMERLRPHLAGMHIHDVADHVRDHAMPPGGSVRFEQFQTIAQSDIIRVMEPVPDADAEAIQAAMAWLRQCWSMTIPEDETKQKKAHI